MNEDEVVAIKLFRNDVGQILDGLEQRKESWEQTTEYLEHGMTDPNFILIEDCDNISEAKMIVEWHDRLIHAIELQIGSTAQ